MRQWKTFSTDLLYKDVDARIIADHVLKYVIEIQVTHLFFRFLTVNKASILKQGFAIRDVCFENAYVLCWISL